MGEGAGQGGASGMLVKVHINTSSIIEVFTIAFSRV